MPATNAEIILVMGFPAAGKSTVCKSYLKTHTRLNRDELGGTLDGLANKMEYLIQKGQTRFILDNTYPTAQSRASAVAVAKKYMIPIRCIIIWSHPKITKNSIQASIVDAQYNACIRMIHTYGRVLSPDEMPSKDPNCFPASVQFTYKNAFERPTRAEGFSQIEVFVFHRLIPASYTAKALILDYDGTLRITKSGEKYPIDLNDIEILPNRYPILKKYSDDGYLLLGVSNQSGIEKGDLTLEKAIQCFEQTNKLLGLKIDYKFCPHHSFPIRCFCRKPMPGLGVGHTELYKLDPSQCIMIGDQTSDATFASRCGFQFETADSFFKSA